MTIYRIILWYDFELKGDTVESVVILFYWYLESCKIECCNRDFKQITGSRQHVLLNFRILSYIYYTRRVIE